MTVPIDGASSRAGQDGGAPLPGPLNYLPCERRFPSRCGNRRGRSPGQPRPGRLGQLARSASLTLAVEADGSGVTTDSKRDAGTQLSAVNLGELEGTSLLAAK